MDTQRVLVTAGASGIGREIVRGFAGGGARVFTCDIDRAALDALADELPGVQSTVCDVGRRADIEAMMDRAIHALGGLDVLVNNAGIYEAHPPLDTSYEDWQRAWARTLAVNLVGAANATYCAIRHMVAAGGGAVVNVSSRGAFRGEPDTPAYGASKAGMNAFGQSMAVALAPHDIRVGTVAPGFVQTDMARDSLTGPKGDSIRAQSPFGRVARPEEVAAAVLWLASDDARFATGSIIDVNGASYLRS